MSEIILQKILFPRANDLKTETIPNSQNNGSVAQEIVRKTEMLYYKQGFPATRQILHENFVFPQRQQVSFDTYFNILSVEKWSRYTFADSNYFLKITLKGKFKVTLLHLYLEQDYQPEKKKKKKDEDVPVKHSKVQRIVLAEHDVDCSSRQTFKFPYETASENGCFAFALQAEAGSEFCSACFVSEVEQPLRDVHLGIGICTFKREQYVLNNVANLRREVFENSQSPLQGKLEVFISDNASSLPQEVASQHVHVVQNKNTGGSGGFTRCMIESLNFNKTASEKLTHLILMDDDIRFETESLERVYSLLRVVRDVYLDAFIGGAMFKMAQPYVQHASGEFWHGTKCENFIETYNRDLDMSYIGNVLSNEIVTDANYQAWWFCTVPMTIISENNLSMPFFIKSDDIEFSLRNLSNLILLNGINVWHESFELKYSAQNEYYTIRNYLITAAAHNVELTKRDILLLMRHYYRHYATNYKYLEIEHLCNAILDFLRGVDYFKKLNLAEVHKKLLPKGYKMVDVKELPVKVTKEKYEHDIDISIDWKKNKWKLAKNTANGLFLPAHGYSVLGMWGGNYAQTYRKKFLVRYEENAQKGFILYRDRKAFLRASTLYRKTKRKLKRRFYKAYRDFQNRWTELCTLENWKKQLDLD